MIIGVCGLIGSGKGTVADYLVEAHGFTKLSFADALKDAVAVLFSWDRALLEGDTEESRAWREKPNDFWSGIFGREITPRYILQVFGTECMRNGFHDDIWVNLVKEKLLAEPNQNFVIPDTRFLNEMEMIRSLGGQIWEVEREMPIWATLCRFNGVEPLNIHRSEWEWMSGQIDQKIENTKNIEWLKTQVDTYIALWYK